MKISPITKKQALDLLKTAAYIGASAALDFLIASTAGTQFGTFTPVINLGLVFLKKLLTEK